MATPSTEELKNGWTEETLTQYLKERARQARDYAVHQEKMNKAQTETVGQYDPHQW